jgi:hypothetical protein
LRWLDLVSMTVLVLAAILFGLALAGSLGDSVIEEGRAVLSSIMCLAGILLFILVAVMVPILSYLFDREGV